MSTPHKHPHKHKDVIVAWANGAEIETRERDGTMWIPATGPAWYVNHQYRVRPEPEVSDRAAALVEECCDTFRWYMDADLDDDLDMLEVYKASRAKLWKYIANLERNVP